MKEMELKVGMEYTVEHIVKDNETAIAYDSGAQPVFATPALVSIMEKAAFTLAKELNIDTVGTIVNIMHKRACKVGTPIRSTARLTAIDGKKLTFNVIVTDAKGVLGEGSHGRYIIDPDKFLNNLD